MSGDPISMTDDDYPGLFQVADTTSQKEQRQAVRTLQWDLICTVTGIAFVTVAELLTTGAEGPAGSGAGLSRQWISGVFWVAGAACLFACTILTLMLMRENHEEGWYGGRAIAETVKTLTWRYMTRTPPYDQNRRAAETDRVFCDDLNKVLQNYRHIVGKLAGQVDSKPQITQQMREVRNAAFETRKETYVKHRLQDQQGWYSSRAKLNHHRGNRVLGYAAACQVATLLLASWAMFGSFFQSAWGSLFVSTASGCAACALAFLGWGQFRQYQEFAHAYTIAAQELGSLITLSQPVSSATELAAFVADAESAISREHTLWMGRRDNRYYPAACDDFGQTTK